MHTIKVKGQCFPSMHSQSGIRQGYPLSPLLFAVVADVLLRKLVKTFPNSNVKAFADDTAMILTDFHSQAAGVMRLFREFAAISGLRLSMPKTVVIPLWKYNFQSFSSFLKDTLPEWHRAQIANHGKYFGVHDGTRQKCVIMACPQNKIREARRIVVAITRWYVPGLPELQNICCFRIEFPYAAGRRANQIV